MKTELMNSPEDWKDNTKLKKIGWSNIKASLYTSRSDLINLIKNQDDLYLLNKFQDTD